MPFASSQTNDLFDEAIAFVERSQLTEPDALGAKELRANGTEKGPGFLGTLQRPSGGISTELSIGVNFDGKETEIPTLVPTLDKNEVDYLLSGGKPTDAIVGKAVEHARIRISEGKNPFAQAENDSLEFVKDEFDEAVASLSGSGFQEGLVPRRQPMPETEHGFFGEVAAGLGRGALRVAATPAYLADVAGEAVGWEGLERTGERGAERVEKFIEESPGLKKSASISGDIRSNPQLWTDPNWYASIVSEGIPTVFSMLIPGLGAARGAKAAGWGIKGIRAAKTAGGLSAAMGLEAGGAAEQARQYEKATGKEISIGKKLQAVIGTGVVAGALEYAPIFRIFGKGAGRKLVRRILEAMATEGSTEGAQEIIANHFAKAGYDADQDMAQGIIESIVGGVLIGGGMGGIAGPAKTFQDQIEASTTPENIERISRTIEEGESEALLDKFRGGSIEDLVSLRQSPEGAEYAKELDRVIGEKQVEPVYGAAKKRVGLFTPAEQAERDYQEYQPPDWQVVKEGEGIAVMAKQGLAPRKEAGAKALPPGQGFDLLPPKPETRLRPSPKKIEGPTYPEGAEYVAGKKAPEELEVKHKPVLTIKEKPFKKKENAFRALKSKRLVSKGITSETHEVVSVEGGFQVMRKAEKPSPVKKEATSHFELTKRYVEETGEKIEKKEELSKVKERYPDEWVKIEKAEAHRKELWEMTKTEFLRPVKAAAYLDKETGKITEGTPEEVHFQIAEKANLPLKDIEIRYEPGFTNYKGKFLTREKANKLIRRPDRKTQLIVHKEFVQEALKSGKLTPEKYAKFHEKDYGPLEAFMGEKVAPKAKAEKLNYTQFAKKYGYISDYDITDHGTLSPSGQERVSKRAKKQNEIALLKRIESNKQGKEAYKQAIIKGEVIDPKGEITKEKLESEDKDISIKQAQSIIDVAKTQIKFIESLGKTAYTKSGKLKIGYQRSVDDYNERIKKAENKIAGLTAHKAKKFEPLTETKSRLLENIKSEKGSSELINDLSRLGADAIKRGHKSFKAFSAEMKTQLGEAWAKVKHLMRRAYADAKLMLANERGLIGGVKAKGVPTGQLAKAQEMLAEGKDKNDIWRETGWMKGVEKGNVWKFEIDDSGAKIKSTEIKRDKQGLLPEKWVLEDILEHEQLFNAYPQLRNIKIKETPGYERQGSDLGQYSSSSNTISLTSPTKRSTETPYIETIDKRILPTLFHEIQHAIQEIEGFAKGGSPQGAIRVKRDLDLAKARLKNSSEFIEYGKQLDILFAMKDLSDSEFNNRIKQLEKDAPLKLKQLWEMPRYEGIAPLEIYSRLAGEIEARDTAARAKLTAKQRREQMPYESQGIPQDQWIVTDGKGTSFSVKAPYEGKKEHPTLTPGARKLLGELEELKKEQKPPQIASSYEQQKDDWFGNKDWAEFRNTVEKNKLQEGIKNNISRTKNVFGKKIFDKKCKDVDRAIHVYLDLKRNPGHLGEFYKKLTKEQQRTVDLAQTIESNPELKVLADYIAGEYEKIGKMALNAGVIRNVLDNYVTRTWKIDNKLTTDVSQKFKTSSRHAKHRVFETILEGQAAGYELQITGATSNLNVLKDEIARVIEDKKLIEETRKTKRQDGSPLISTHKINDTDKKIEHPNFKVWEFVANVDLVERKIDKATGLAVGDKVRIGKNKAIGSVVDIGDTEITVSFKVEGNEELKEIPIDPEGDLVGVTRVRPEGKNFFITDEGTVLEKRELYASKEIAKDLNKILGVSKLKGLPGVDTLTKYNAIFKSWILVTSFFHHCAFLRSYYLPSQHKTKAEWNPVKTFKTGKKAINELKPELELLVRNGLTMFKMQDWEESILRQEDTIFGKILDKTTATKAIKDKINNLRERQANFLFGNFGAALKTQAALIELRNMTRKHPDMDVNERTKMVARLINADFGGLHHGRMGRDPTIQHIMRLGLLAPDWTESNIRTMVGAFKAGGSKEKAMYRSFWASAITKGLSAVFAANILLAAFDEDDFMERYKKAWEAGRFRWLDIDITPIYKMFGGETEARKYFSLFGHFRDPLKFVMYPIRSLHHKGSVVYGTFHEAMAGTDWRGQRFTTLSELTGVDDKGVYLTTTKTHEIGEQKGGKLTGKLTTYKAGRKGPIGFGQMPSYALSQLVGVQPIQVQNFIAMLTGEVAAFDAIARSLGMHTSTTYPKEPSDDYPTENLTKFRKTAKEMDVLIRTIEHYRKTGDIKKAVELAKTNRNLLQYKKGINEIRRKIGLINGRIKIIHYQKNLTPEQKKEKINKLLDYRNKILENAYKVMLKK